MYPDSWPKADPARPTSLQSRITEQQKRDLYSRKITTRDLAKELDVHEKWLSIKFPGKCPPNSEQAKELAKARKEFKLAVGVEVLEGKYTIREASVVASVSWNTMFRFVKQAKELRPDLVEKYAEITAIRRRNPNVR